MLNSQQLDIFHVPSFVEQKAETESIIPSKDMDFSHKHDKHGETYFPSVGVFNSHCRLIYDGLMRGERWTSEVFYQKTKSHKFTSRCSDLRQRLVQFSHEQKETTEGVRYYEYFMDNSQIAYNKEHFSQSK